MSDDSIEFDEVATASPSDDSAEDSNLLPTSEDRRAVQKKKRDGKCTQWADIGGSYIPTQPTVAIIPADCYALTATNDGTPIFMRQNLVTDKLLRLPDSKSDEVLAEIEHFWTLKETFRDFGFAHKRGFLLWGPPGSGKTSTIALSIETMVKRGGIVILCEHPGLTAAALKYLRMIEPERPCAVIMEDMDTIVRNYGESGLLSLLDGEHQVDNVVYIATTNYPERLDGRIINRPSRFDRVVKIGMPNDAARKMYLEYKKIPLIHDGFDLVAATKDYSIAHIKEMIISVFCQGNPTKDTLERLDKMRKAPKSDDTDRPMGIAMGLGAVKLPS